MKIYIYDPSDGRTKNWSSLCRSQYERIRLISLSGRNLFASFDNRRMVFHGGIILLHGPTSVTDPAVVAVMEVLSTTANLVAIVLSGGGLSIPESHDRLYFYNAPVKKEDPAFSAHFQAFFNHLQQANGRPDFSLLEPSTVLSSLLSHALVVQYGLDVSIFNKLEREAAVEFEKCFSYIKTVFGREEENNFREDGISETSSFDNYQIGPERINLKAFRKVIDLLRDDL